jgi:hypothetical protein
MFWVPRVAGVWKSTREEASWSAAAEEVRRDEPIAPVVLSATEGTKKPV